MQVVVFTINNGRFAVDSERVRGISQSSKIGEYPHDDKRFDGVVEHKGSRIPALDINRILKMENTDEKKANTLICNMKGGEVAILVDDVRAVMKIEANQLMEADLYEDQPYIKGTIRKNNSTISILDVDKLI